MVGLDGNFWNRLFKEKFCRQINVFCDFYIGRISPLFNNIDIEAEEVSENEYNHLLSTSYDEAYFLDLANLAETAQEAGMEYWQEITNMHQALCNLIVVALYHLFEQQLLLFHRRQVLHPSEENEIKKIQVHELKKRLKLVGVDIELLKSWGKTYELELVANSIKHAEGRSTLELRELRPDLFEHPVLRENKKTGWLAASPHTYNPLGGEDIYITTDDLDNYRNALIQFWDEFGNAILDPNHRD